MRAQKTPSIKVWELKRRGKRERERGKYKMIWKRGNTNWEKILSNNYKQKNETN